MKESQLKIISTTEDISVREVDVYINSTLLSISGNWQWDLNCDTIFCSDVMAALSQHYPGTKGIIHPDDIEDVKQKLTSFGNGPGNIGFRIITTYGEIKNISGTDCFVKEPDELRVSDPEKEIIERTAKQKELEKNNEDFHLLKQTSDYTEMITKTGRWYINAATLETYYSDNVFRIHGILPQSLNAHPHTFNGFIHPEDCAAVTDAFDTALRERLPLHIEYRIIVTDEKEKFITLVTHWSHNLKGEDILSGLITDRTESVFEFTKAEEAENKLEFHNKILQHTEKEGNTAFCYINLLTRQTYYSDNYFRIHGLKPQSVALRQTTFINFVHPDDREMVEETINTIRMQHAAPDIEYRIIRTDKKLRYIRQKAQLLPYAGNELIIICIIHDITQQVYNERKLQEVDELLVIKNYVQTQSEALAKISSWMWEPETGNRFWSDNIYDLLGFRKSVKEISQELLLKAVLPEDRNRFNDEMRSVSEGAGDSEFYFRILKTGEVRNMKGIFKMQKYENRKFFIGTMQDVTDSTQTQEQLDENLQLNQLLTENILDKVFITDVSNNIILWNKKCEEYFRLKKEQVVGKNYFDVFPDQKTEKSIVRFNEVLKGDPVNEKNERSSLKKYHDLHMTPLKNSDNKIIGILHVMHDVTRELLLRNNLNERLNFIENLLEETVDRIIVLDKNLTYSYWNKKAEQHYHINKEYVIGKSLLEVFPSFVNDPFYPEFKKALKGETVHVSAVAESVHQQKFSETWLVPLLNDNKEVNGILWIVHDLSKEVALRIATEQLDVKEKHLQKANDELVRQNTIFEYAEQIANMGTWIWNPGTGKAHYSDNLFRLFGMEPQEVEPTYERITKFIHPDDRPIMEASAAQLSEGKASVKEYRIIRKDGIIRNFRNRKQIIAFNDQKYVIGTTEDITELYQKELAQKTSELLLKKKDEFISIASHELKTPVTNIKASIQILQDLVSETIHPEDLAPFLERSSKQADKLAELMNDLLDASTIDEGKIKLKKSLFNIREAIQESADEICGQVKECEIKMEGEKNAAVFADRVRVQQVITNFITNSLKYSPGNKTLRIKIEKDDENVKVSVVDTGIGISENNLPHVFEKYFRVEETANKFTGLGLGLYISKEIIKKHKGETGVESAKGKGSTFWFTLPLPNA